MKSVRTLTFLLMSLLAVVLATGCADAQTLGTTGNELSLVQNISFDADGEVEIVAPIEAMDEGTIVIAGQTVHLTEATEIKGQIDVGTMVKVHVFLAEDGTLVAREIEPVADGDDDNANGNENTNENDNANDNANDNGNANDDNGNENEADDNANGNENANEAPEGATGEIEIVAFVEALDEGSVTVAGWTLLLTPQSEVKGQLEVGMLVKVHVWVMDDGTLVVREIEPAHDDDDDNANGNGNANENANENGNANDDNGNDNEMVSGVVGEMEIVAPLEAMDEFSVMVAGHELLLTPQSEVKGQLEVGMLVKVHVWVMDDGSLVVREIEPAHDDDDEDNDNRNDNEAQEMEIEAPIDAIGEGTVVVAGQTLVLTPQTKVKGQLEVGAMVKVRVLVMADGTLMVREIKVLHDDDDNDDDNANVNDNNANDDDDENDNEDHANANDNDDDDRNDNHGDDNDDNDDDRNNNGGDHNANNPGPGGGDDNNNDDRGGDDDPGGNDNGDDNNDDDDHGGNDNGDDNNDDDDHGGNDNDDDDDDDDDHGGNNNDDDDHGRDDD